MKKWSPNGHQVVTKWSPSGHQDSPSGHQVVTKWSVDSGCHKFSENIWFAWSNMCYKGNMSHTHVKVEQYSAEAESAIPETCS